MTIEAQVIMRPARISPMQWLTFWEAARDAKDDAAELEALRDENKELIRDVVRLENKLESIA